MMYTIQDFNRIQLDGFHYVMSPSAMSLVNSLAETVGAQSYSRTPIFPKKDRKVSSSRQRHASNDIRDDDWQAMRDFKKTEMAVKEGNDKRISEIRGALNKLTADNYNAMKADISARIEECEEEVEHFDAVMQAIFDIATTNMFYSAMYASLYKDLRERWNVFDTMFNDKLQGHIALFNEIESVDPAKDYDRFCAINKDNERRRALSTFLTHLVLNDILSVCVLVDAINTMQLSVEELIYTDDKMPIVEELVENIYILVVGGKDRLITDKCWSGLNSTFRTMSRIPVKSTPSFSNKVMFKYMDIVDNT
jgi:hypothetical protein